MDRPPRRNRPILAFAVLLAALPAAAADPPPLRATELIGREVRDAAAAAAGTVTEVFVDPAAHRVAALGLDLKGRPRVCAVTEIAFSGDESSGGPPPLRMPEGCEEGGGIAAAPSWRRATDIVKAHVRDRGDAVVGDVKDLYLDAASGRVTYALVDFIPSWFEAEGWAAVPIASLQPKGQGYVAAFDPAVLRPVDAAKAAAAPPPPQPVDARLSKLLGRPVVDGDGAILGRVTALGLDLQRNLIATASVQASGGTIVCAVGPRGLAIGPEAFKAPEAPLASMQGCGADARPGPTPLMPARELLAADVRNERGDPVGRLRDVVVTLDTAKLHYLVADFQSGWVRDGDVVALPLRPVRREGGKPFVTAGLMELQGRPVFPEKRLADVWSPAFAKGMQQYLYAR